jgi:hypothetical protein
MDRTFSLAPPFCPYAISVLNRGLCAVEYGLLGCVCCSESGEGLRRWEKPERAGRVRAEGLPETTDAYEGRRALRGGSLPEARESKFVGLCCW